MSDSPFVTGLSSASSAQLREHAAAALAEAERLDRVRAELDRADREARKPKCPEMIEGEPVFLTFAKYLSGREYAYAAVGWRAGVNSTRWAVTGQGTNDHRRGIGAERFNWPGLLALVGEANWSSIRPLTPGEPLIAPADEPPVAERLGRYGTVESTSDPTAADPHVSPSYGRGGFAGGGVISGYEG